MQIFVSFSSKYFGPIRPSSGAIEFIISFTNAAYGVLGAARCLEERARWWWVALLPETCRAKINKYLHQVGNWLLFFFSVATLLQNVVHIRDTHIRENASVWCDFRLLLRCKCDVRSSGDFTQSWTDVLTIQDVTYRLSRNVGTELPWYAA